MPAATDELLSRLVEDRDFRDQFRQDPIGAASRSGIPLSPEQRETLRQLDTSGSTEELLERVSKTYRTFSDARLKRAIRAI